MTHKRIACSMVARLPARHRAASRRVLGTPAGWHGEVYGLSNADDDPVPKPRSFADAAALLPSVVPSPKVKPAEAPPRETPPAAMPGPVTAGPASPPVSKVTTARAGIFAAAFPPGAALSSAVGLRGLLPGLAAFVRRRVWILALSLVAAGGFAAWHVIGGVPVVAGGSSPATQASASVPPDTSEAAPQRPASGTGRPQPGPSPPSVAAAGRTAAEASPAPLLAVPADTTAAGSPSVAPPGAAPVPYSLIVLHPRPASARGDAANDRIAALLQPLTTRLEMQKKAGPKGRLTVHYFHDEDAEAAKALADTVRTPGSRVNVRGPVRTRAPWPRNAFEVWLRGP